MPRYAFGPFSLDPEARVLLRDGEPMPIAGKALDVLVVLVQNRGRLIDKDELLSRVWTGTIVEEANLSQSIFTVRKILGDNPKDHRYIATVSRPRYSVRSAVTELTGETLHTAGAPQRPASDSVINGSLFKSHKIVAVSIAAVAVAAVGVTWLVLRRPVKAPADLVERRLTFNSSASSDCKRRHLAGRQVPRLLRPGRDSRQAALNRRRTAYSHACRSSRQPLLCRFLVFPTGQNCLPTPEKRWARKYVGGLNNGEIFSGASH